MSTRTGPEFSLYNCPSQYRWSQYWPNSGGIQKPAVGRMLNRPQHYYMCARLRQVKLQFDQFLKSGRLHNNKINLHFSIKFKRLYVYYTYIIRILYMSKYSRPPNTDAHFQFPFLSVQYDTTFLVLCYNVFFVILWTSVILS